MSQFLRIMRRGQPKVKFSKRKSRLLMAFSDEQHKQIARLLKKWLDSDKTNSGRSQTE